MTGVQTCALPILMDAPCHHHLPHFTTDFAMVIDIPPMAEPEPYRPPNHPSSLALSASSSSAHNINSQSASLQDHTSRYSVRTGESTGWTGVSTFGGEDEEGRGASAAAIPTDLEYVKTSFFFPAV